MSRHVRKIKCKVPGCEETIAYYSGSGMCRKCYQAMNRTRVNPANKKGNGKGMQDAVCFRCKRKWKCRSNQDPRWSWCDECRKIVNDRTAEAWVDCDSHVPGAVGRY